MKLLRLKKSDEYLYHRYQEQNDKFVWKHILDEIDSPIFHMDFSENLMPTPKFEAQSAHFSKRQFSLHCTVMHNPGSNKFIYHLSDDMSHDSYFTMAVVNDLVTRFAPEDDIIRFKSDNCLTQYKCKYVFYQWRALATKSNKILIVYYGVSVHGKGLVDAMSGFAVKTPMRMAIVTQEFFFSNTKCLQEYLISLDNLKSDREYFYFDVFERKQKNERERHPISKCMKQNMSAYFPDGSIRFKENICSCDSSIVGKFIECRIEKGVEKLADDSSSESDSDYDSNPEDGSESEQGDECYKIVGKTVFDAVEIGSVVEIYSPPNASELFYLCEVVGKEVAKEDVLDEFSHPVSKDSPFLKCRYLERIDEKKGAVFYKRVLYFTKEWWEQHTCYHIKSSCHLMISEKLTINTCQYMDLISMI